MASSRIPAASVCPGVPRRQSWFPLLAVALLTGACRGDGAGSGASPGAPLPAPDLGPVVARVGDMPIHAAEVTAQAARDRVSPGAALETLLRFHLLAERARQRRPAAGSRPADQAGDRAERQALLVQRLLERDFEGQTRPDQIPEAELRRAYDRVKTHFVHPRMVEVGLLSLYTGAEMKPDARSRAREAARQLEQHLARNPPDSLDKWAALVAVSPWKESGLRYWRFFQGPTSAHGPFGGKLAAAIHKLRRPGDRSGLIEDDSGYHFAWHVSEQPARNEPFDRAREEVRSKYHPTWRQQRFLQYTGELATAHGAEVFPDRLFRVTGRPGS